ncbi:rab3 GTPase-activating protein catalytic subunit isoform X2 [Hyalella azteca]|uniref:Rab3 GTPase-activating protein catalytic subunit n=1 Tax=Hyalella azteca TaxID=294128 RepID=A0A979FWZ5_HYAAZ|nr:rab3 GTPase-activating protein catalytic subunit isoform X2 [Hyalella azteca]
MHSQDGDEEVFEIVDFTTASEWEVFTAAVEEAIQGWGLAGGGRSIPPPPSSSVSASSQWREQKQIINYSDFPFELSYHCPLETGSSEESSNHGDFGEEESYEDSLPPSLAYIHDCSNCFPNRAHCVARWYGLREFIIAAPASSSCSVAPSKARLLLSALTLAANNTGCEVAMLVQVLKPAERVFMGSVTAPGLRATLDMIHFRCSPPVECQDYEGLVELISDKVGIERLRLEPVSSIRFTYIINEWPEEACWAQTPPDLDLELGDLGDLGYSGLKQLPFGLLYDPVRELHLSAAWPRLPHGSFEDSLLRFTLDPCDAPCWTAKVLPPAGGVEGPEVAGLLGEHLMELLHACRDERSVPELLGSAFSDHGAQGGRDVSSALDRLTEHAVPSLGAVLLGPHRHRAAGNKRGSTVQQGPLSEEVIAAILNFLFPEEYSTDDDNDSAYPTTFARVPHWQPHVQHLPDEHPLKDVCVGLKTAPAEGLVWRLSVVCCHALHSLGGLPAVAHLLYEVLLELRFRWDNCLVVPGVSPAFEEPPPPDLASCLLQQKLQMLNCCIAHRERRERGTAAASVAAAAAGSAAAGSAGTSLLGFDEDEFFDCVSDDDEEKDADSSKESNDGLMSWDEPEGRVRRCGELRLLHSRRRLYVPATQDPAPCTEDKLEQQAELLLRLGDTDEGSAMRARLMSSSLLSDMESFKAANPGCVLADFVRWYSPRDWVPVAPGEDLVGVEVVDGHRLSDRMTIPGNLWQEVWKGSLPVPARRQKRLFDDAREAESALQWLASLGPGALCRHLLPVLLHAACCRTALEPHLYTLPSTAVWGQTSAYQSLEALPPLQHSESLPALLCLLTQRLGRLSRQPCDLNKYRDVIEQLSAVERCLGRAMSLRHKLLPQEARNVEPKQKTLDNKRTSEVDGSSMTEARRPSDEEHRKSKTSSDEISQGTSDVPASRQASSEQTRRPSRAGNASKHSSHGEEKFKVGLEDSDDAMEGVESNLGSQFTVLQGSDDTQDDKDGKDAPKDGKDDSAVLLSLISSLLSSGEVDVEGAAKGVAGQALLRLFERSIEEQERQGSLPRYSMEQRAATAPSARRSLAEQTRSRLGYPGAREYIVRVRAELPSRTSRLMPHRLYATFLKGDFRVAGLFTQDATFS